MADRLMTLLGTESSVLVFDELLVAQDDICSIGKTVDALLMEFDQQAFEVYLSSGSEGSAAGRTRRTPKVETPWSSLCIQPTSTLSSRVLKLPRTPVVTSHGWWGVLLLQ